MYEVYNIECVTRFFHSIKILSLIGKKGKNLEYEINIKVKSLIAQWFTCSLYKGKPGLESALPRYCNDRIIKK